MAVTCLRRSGAMLSLALALAVLLSLPSPAPLRACAAAPQPGYQVRIVEETALIAYDSSTKTEHFLRSARFDTASPDFGFFVPTPTYPELAEASADVFPILADITKPSVIYRTVRRDVDFGCSGSSATGSTRIGTAGTGREQYPPPVVVYQRTKIGALDAVVLKAVSAKALQDWLKANGYATRPALEAWFAVYIRKGWFITAFRIGAGETSEAVNPAVRISFKTDVPVYPYLEPGDQPGWRPKGESRLLRLFVLSDARVQGLLGMGSDATRFAGETAWSKPVDSDAITRALAAGKVPASPRDWHLTEFEDRTDWRGNRGDVYFPVASDQALVERPPVESIIYVSSYRGIPCLILGGMPILILIVSLLVARFVSRRAKGLPPKNPYSEPLP